jgi:hypothetical protein
LCLMHRTPCGAPSHLAECLMGHTFHEFRFSTYLDQCKYLLTICGKQKVYILEDIHGETMD